MKLGFLTNAYRNYPLSYALETLSDYGYKGIELWAKGAHISPFDTKDRWAEIRKQIENYNLDVFAVSAHLDFVAPSAQKRCEQIDRFIRVLDLAAYFGVGQVHTASGGLYEKISPELQEQYFIEAMQKIGAEAKARGIRIGLEPEPEKWLSTPAQLIELFANNFSQDTFGVVVDLAHADGIGENLSDYIRKLAPYLTHIHLDDVHAAAFPHRHLLPGEGCVDYIEIFNLLNEINYKGWLSMELNRHINGPAQAARLACQHIERYKYLWSNGD